MIASVSKIIAAAVIVWEEQFCVMIMLTFL